MRLKIVLLFAVVLLSGCSSAKKSGSDVVSPSNQKNLDLLSRKASEQTAKCEEWASRAQKLLTKVTQSETAVLTKKQAVRAMWALEAYPERAREADELIKIFISSEEQEGFPKDYNWNWSPVTRAQNCRSLVWFELVKGASRALPKDDRKLSQLVRTKLETRLSRPNRLIDVLLAGHALQLVVDKKQLPVSDDKVTELKQIISEGQELRHKVVRESKEAPEEFAHCEASIESGDCSKPEAFSYFGQNIAEEIKESQVIAEKLEKWLREIN